MLRDELKTVIVTAAVILEEKRVLVTQRNEASHYGLFWEFPGGKIKEGEEPRQALRRELQEELGIDAAVGTIFDAVFYVYPEYPVLLLFYFCRVERGVPRPLGCRDLRWVSSDEIEKLTMLPADAPVLERLKNHLITKDNKKGVMG